MRRAILIVAMVAAMGLVRVATAQGTGEQITQEGCNRLLGDLNDDNRVDYRDAGLFLEAYAHTDRPADLNVDGWVTEFDLELFWLQYGRER